MVTQRIEKITQGWLLQGREEGEKAGWLNILRHQLESKFGGLSQDAAARLAQADGVQIRTWSERILSARTLDEVFAG